jgi:arylsulfatase
VADIFDVVVADYASIDTASEDFAALVRGVEGGTVRSEGVVLAEHDAQGHVRVVQTADFLGRLGAGWDGGVGVVVGLLSPPTLASRVAGAGAVAGRLARHQADTGLEEGLAARLRPGTAAVVALVDDEDRAAAQTALAHCPAELVVPLDRAGVEQLKTVLAQAVGRSAGDRTVLPMGDPVFAGTAGRTLADSVPDWSLTAEVPAPPGAPNVLLVLLDDAGFGGCDTFGGPIRTPNLTRVQQMGLTFNRFHVAGAGAPTRAALLTGRNHHRVGLGSLPAYSGPFPGYSAVRPRECTTLPRILQENGYATGGFGTWQPLRDREDRVSDETTDDAVAWLRTLREQDRTKPWFLYYAASCGRAPHPAPTACAEHYKGRFDRGWDKLREETFELQQELGVVPLEAELTERPDLVPAWDSLTEGEQTLAARQMEGLAGCAENADRNVGRLLDAIEETGDLENTLILYIWGDGGTGMEGSRRPHEVAAAWAHACSTPFRWGGQVASHLGGSRAAMVVAWPGRIPSGGSVRAQFTHCVDVVPTVLEAAGIPEPRLVDGVAQEPMDGTSFLYTFDGPRAAERHTVQYFELLGSRAVYQDGWWACARLDRAPWDFSPQTLARFAPGAWDPDRDTWELYYLPDDFSQAHDLALDHPEKLRELQELWWQEAGRNKVLPLLGGLAAVYMKPAGHEVEKRRPEQVARQAVSHGAAG